MNAPPDPTPLSGDDLARLIDVALEEAEREKPLWDALDAAVDAHGAEAVRHALLRLAADGAPSARRAA